MLEGFLNFKLGVFIMALPIINGLLKAYVEAGDLCQSIEDFTERRVGPRERRADIIVKTGCVATATLTGLSFISGCSYKTIESIKEWEVLFRCANVPLKVKKAYDKYRRGEMSVREAIEYGLIAPLTTVSVTSAELSLIQENSRLDSLKHQEKVGDKQKEKLTKSKLGVSKRDFHRKEKWQSHMIKRKHHQRKGHGDTSSILNKEELSLRKEECEKKIEAARKKLNELRCLENFTRLGGINANIDALVRRLLPPAAPVPAVAAIPPPVPAVPVLPNLLDTEDPLNLVQFRRIPIELEEDPVFSRYQCDHLSYCPIRDPVAEVTPDGVTKYYERDQILKSLEEYPGISPATRLPLTADQLVEKPALKALIEHRLKQYSAILKETARGLTDKKLISSSKERTSYSSFQFNGDNYLPYSTVGDGACALHALIGHIAITDPYKGEYYFSNARKEYINKLSECYLREPVKDLLQQILFDKLQSHLNGDDGEGKLIFEHPSIFKEKGMIRNDIERAKLRRKMLCEAQEIIFKQIMEIEDMAIWQGLTQRIKGFDENRNVKSYSKEEIQRLDPKKRNNLFRANIQDLIDILRETEQGKKLRKNDEDFKKMNSEEDPRLKKFIADNLQAIFVAYRSACDNNNYWFSDIELKIAAELFKKRIFIKSDHEDIPVYGDPNNPLVVIHHNGHHYSRCEKSELPVTQNTESTHMTGHGAPLEIRVPPISPDLIAASDAENPGRTLFGPE